MGSSADIYSMVRPQERGPGPLDNYSAMMQLMAMGDTSQLNALHRQKLTGDLQEEEAFKSRLADWVKAGGQGDLPADAYAASPSRAAAFDKTRLEGVKLKGDIKKNDVETHAAQAKYFRDILAGVTDQTSYENALGEGQRANAAWIKGAPATYSPEWVRSHVMNADQFITQTTPKFEKADIGGQVKMVDVNPVTNPAVKGLNFTKTITPGEVLQANQPKYDEARGVWVFPPASGARPAAAPAPGAPAPAGAQPPAAPGAPPAAAPGAAPGATPGFVRPAGLPPRSGDVQVLRHEFNQLPEVKAYRDIIPVVEAARTSPDTRAGDLQLGYAVGKVLDPNSVVREGEIKMVGDAAPIYEKYKGEFESVFNSKGRFTPETRKQLVAMLDNATNQREGAYKTAEATYRGIAEKSGIPVDQVIITPQKRTGQEQQPGAPKMFDAMPDPTKYNGKRLQADDGTVYQSDGKVWKRQAR